VRRYFVLLLLGVMALLTFGPLTSSATAASSASEPQPTFVSFTFDDTLATQKLALDVLKNYDMTGTLYVNSPRISKDSDYLSYEQLQDYQSKGFEIGGHTLDHPDLTTLSTKDLKHEICDDRATLLKMGFRASNFAYPLGANDAKVREVVRDCGYNSARALPGLRSPSYGCDLDCPTAETIPAKKQWAIRTPTTARPSTTLADLKQYVTQAEDDKGGWVPLVFHRICDSRCATVDTPSDNSIPLDTFIAFVDWLSKRPVSTSVATVADVIGGKMQPANGKVQHFGHVAIAKPGAAPAKPDSAQAAFTIGPIRVNQTLIMLLGISIALTFVFTYRYTTKGDRYVGRHQL
jgi:peptidoglycan/xylan/chitin deacetylase (PgdA/CDA1 family)